MSVEFRVLRTADELAVLPEFEGKIWGGDDDRVSVNMLVACLEEGGVAIGAFHGDRIVVEVDKRDATGGSKNWDWIKKGVPVRVEIGPRDIEKGLEAGFFNYLTKPIKVNEFMATLDLALDVAGVGADRPDANLDAAAV